MMCGEHRISSLLLAAMTLALTGCVQSEPIMLPEGPGRVVALDNPEIDEASGLAVSRRHPDRLWLHNDSGGAAALFAVNRQGQSQGRVELDGVQNIDWEDMDAFVLDAEPMLLVADVGDNNAVRPFVMLHLLNEPELSPGGAAVRRSLRVTYEDGPRDCEAVAVDAADAAVYLLTKRDTPPRLYRVSLGANPLLARAAYLGTVESIPPPTTEDILEDPRNGAYRSQPTAMSFSADGRRALIVTYKDAYLYRRDVGQTWLDALNRSPQRIDIPQFAQTEAGGMTPDGRSAFIASEQLPAAMVETALP